jgi:phage terminase large subunit
VSVLVNWMDNPWFPEVLKREMEHDFTVDADKAEHIWNGAYGAGEGSILAKWVNLAHREGRVNACEYDPAGAPIEISSDLGFRDTASWWFWQRKVGGFTLFDYMGESGWDADDWGAELVKRIGGRKLGKIWLPHDARTKTFQSKHSSVERFIQTFGADKVGIVPVSRKADQISAARKVINRCEFNASQCEEGLDGLSAWEFEFNEETGVLSREPLHNWASHPSDAFAYGCQVMEEQAPPENATPKPIQDFRHQTLDELWRSMKPRRERY